MRALLALLLVANLLFFGWSRGWLDGVAGVRAHGDREPERLALQVRPEAIRVLTPQAAASAAAAASEAASAASAALATAEPAASAAASGTASGAPNDAANGAASSAANGAASRVSGGASVPPVSAGAASSPAAAGSAPGAAVRVSASASAATATVCLEAGPFAEADLAPARAALVAALPAGTRWADIAVPRGGAWLVYMGTFANREAQQAKEEQLRRIRVEFEELAAPAALGPGLSLGRFDNRAAADAALAQMTRRGIRTARVVEVAPPVVSHVLRVDRAEPPVAARLAALKSPALRGGWVACRSG